MTTSKQDKVPKQETTAIATYGEWTPEAMERESREMASGGEYWKPEVGRNIVRFLPPRVGQQSPFVVNHQHFVRMPGVDKPIVFSCPRMHEQKRCLVCSKADQLEASGSQRDAAAARDLRPSRRMFANIVVNPSEAGAKISLWGFGKTVYDQLRAIKEDDENGGDFLNPKTGFDISVRRKGTGKTDTEYHLQAARQSTPLANPDWLSALPDLRKLIKVPTEEQQRRLLDGEDPKDVWADSERKPRREAAMSGDVIDVDPGGRTAEDDLFDDEVEV